MMTRILACVFILLVAPAVSWSAIAYVNSQTYEAEAGSGAGGSFTFSSGANRIAFVCRAIRENGGAVAADTAVPTIGGVNTTQVGTGISNAAGVMRAELYYLLNPGSGSQTVATTPAASTDRNLTIVIEYTGVHQTTPIGTPTTVQLSVTNLDVDSIASAVNDVVGACLSVRSQNPHTAVTPDATAPVSTEQANTPHSATSSTLTSAWYDEAGATTSTNIRVDLDSSAQSAAIGVAIKPAADPVVIRNRGVVFFP